MTDRPRAIGAMRLSTAKDRDDDHAGDVLRAAVDAGVDWIDTADAYCHDARDVGHNERLIAGFPVRIGTKGGIVRTGGKWIPNGRASHLEAACAASAERLGRPPDLYQLHVVDPAVPFETSVRALARCLDRGDTRAVGLCNVTAGQLARAADLLPVAAVQVELSPWRDDALRDGVLDFCASTGARLLAWRPLGGPEGLRRLARDPVVADVARALDASPAEVAIAWLRDLHPAIVPLPGPTRIETARSCARALALDPATREALDARFPAARFARTSRAERRPPHPRGDVVVVMGIQGSGKSTRAVHYEARGYVRLNRDTLGGRLADLLPRLDEALAAGRSVVLDNTYPGRAQRNRVIETAWARGAPVRCELVDTSLDDAQVNVARRLLRAYGRLPEPPELERSTDPGTFGPRVLHDWLRAAEPPTQAEGFERVDVLPFARTADPEATAAGLLVAMDAIRQGDALRPGVAAFVAAWDGPVGGFAWHPSTPDPASVEAATVARLGVAVDVAWCPHPAGPPVCWCRSPLPGLGVAFLDRHRCDPARSALLGASTADRRLAAVLGLSFHDVGALAG